MADTMKFGPEWLRALSDGTNVASPPPSPAVGMPMYKLAEHRYGREEMLALCQPSREPPEEFKEFHGLLSEKLLQPLALIPLSDDEQRLMSQSVNSTVVLRMMGRGSSGPPTRGGRGGLPDRGRGRGRGRGEGYYPRGPFEEEPGSYGRGRIPRDAWDDVRGGRFDRSFPPGRTFEDEVTSPPRREFSRSMSTENWRDSKKEEPDEETGGDWRKAPNRDRWGGARGWREPRENYGREGYERGGKYDDYRDRPPYERGRFQRTMSTGSWDDTGEYDVPEWSTADVDDIEGVGTFDSSGAFMSMKDKNGVEYGALESTGRPRSASKEKEPGKEKDQDNFHASDSGNKQADKPATTKTDSDKLENKVDPSIQERERGKKTAPSNTTSSKRSDEKDVTKPNGHLKSSEPKAAVQNEIQQVIAADKTQSEQTIANRVSQKNTSDSRTVTPNVISVVTEAVKPPSSSETVIAGRNSLQKATKQEEDANFDHLEKAAENLVAALGDEEETLLEKAEGVQIQQHDALASEALSLDHEDAKKWFYRDPQGDLQGPFTSSEMAEWFSAGYFTMNLLVKRGCDGRFQGLGDLIKSWGRIPFLPGTAPPPLKNSQNVANMSSSSSVPVTQPSLAGVATSVLPGVASMPAASASLSQAGLTVASLPGIATVSMPGVPSGPMPSMPAVSVPGMPPVSIPGMSLPGVPAGTIPNPADIQNPDALKAIQQQMLMQQQMMHQHMMRQIQLQQLVQQLQVQPEFANLSAAQQQQHALKVMLQQQLIMQQQAQLPVQQAQATQQQQQQAKLSPNASSKAEMLQRSMSVSQPANKEAPGFHRSLSQPGKEELPESIWGMPPESTVAPGTSWKAQARSVWDLEAKQVQQWSDKDRQSAEKALQEQVKQEERLREEQKREEHRRQAEEKARKREQDELEKCQEAERLKAIERQRELERRQELERQRLEQLAIEQEELRRLHEEEEVKRQLEEQKRLDEQRRREEDRRRLEQERLLEEQRRIQEEDRLKKEMEEKIRQDEIRRRQEKFDELRRQQQQEALRRLKQEQLNIQLPATAQWANATSGATTLPSGGAGTPTGTLSLTQIQQLEAEREQKDQEERRQMEIHRQQVAAIQQQQQQLQGRSWASAAHSNIPVSAGAPSLLEIQQEQARQQNNTSTSQKQPQPKAAVPLVSTGVWASGSSSQSQGWAQEGAWGNPKTKASLGFWDEALSSAPVPQKVNKGQDKKGSLNNNSHFPTLGITQTTNGSRATTKTKKSNKDEETVQRLFQALKPKDEFTRWCENALKGMQTSVDIPTFVAFLMEVDSPYEVHDYVRSYLGESRDAIEFGSQFLEKRSKYKTQLRQQQQPEDDIWGPAPAVNPNHGRVQAQNQNNNSLANMDDSKLSKRKKKKMQKVDQSFLGFTVHAAPDRVNIGPIDSTTAE